MKWDNILTKYLATKGITVTAENAAQMSQEDFKEIRYDGFGASDSSRILNVNPFPGGDPITLLQDKIDRVYDETISKKAIVRMGSDLEDFIIKKASMIIDKFIFKPSHMYGRKENGLNTNFDGVLFFSETDIIPCEIKTISIYGGKYYDYSKAILLYGDEGDNPEAYKEMEAKEAILEYAPDDYMPERRPIEKHILYNAERLGIPPYYYTQIQQQMDFLDCEYGYLLAMDIKNWTLYAFKIPRDSHTIKNLNSRAFKLYIKLLEARQKEKECEKN